MRTEIEKHGVPSEERRLLILFIRPPVRLVRVWDDCQSVHQDGFTEVLPGDDIPSPSGEERVVAGFQRDRGGEITTC